VVSASPIREGSVESFRSKIAGFFSSRQDVSIETTALGELNVRECQHCNWCNTRQEEDKYCTLDAVTFSETEMYYLDMEEKHGYEIG